MFTQHCTQVVSESLLINKEREARREEKKKLKALGKADNTIALGMSNIPFELY